MDRIIPTMDAGVSKVPLKVLKKQKFKLLTSHKVKAVERNGDTVVIKADDKKGNEVELTADYCLVAVGRSPYTEGLNAEAAGVTLDDRGKS